MRMTLNANKMSAPLALVASRIRPYDLILRTLCEIVPAPCNSRANLTVDVQRKYGTRASNVRLTRADRAFLNCTYNMLSTY